MPTRRTAYRALTAVALGAVALLGPAAPASADPAEPTDYRSRVLTTRPPLPEGVELRVVGGDAFLELDVESGHTVTVSDYLQGTGDEPPPYLEVTADGTVRVNELSVAAAINDARYGGDSSTARPDDDPRWSVVATGGRHAWHDHRIHWMSPTRPAAVDADGRVDMGGTDGTWTVDLVVDGKPTVVVGELVLEDSPSPLPWLLVALVAAAAVLAAAAIPLRAGRPPAHRLVAAGLLAVSALAALLGGAEWRAAPEGSGASPVGAVVPLVALAAALVAAASPRSRPAVRLAALAAAAGALAGWGFLRREVLSRAVLPTTLPFPLDRLGTALSLGLAVGTASLLAWRPPTVPSPPAPPTASQPDAGEIPRG